MKKKHLEFYKHCMECGTLPLNSLNSINYYGGLCGCADMGMIDPALFDLFNQFSGTYWAYGQDTEVSEYDQYMNHLAFNPLRQTIVLFMAAINNEL